MDILNLLIIKINRSFNSKTRRPQGCELPFSYLLVAYFFFSFAIPSSLSLVVAFIPSSIQRACFSVRIGSTDLECRLVPIALSIA